MFILEMKHNSYRVLTRCTFLDYHLPQNRTTDDYLYIGGTSDTVPVITTLGIFECNYVRNSKEIMMTDGADSLQRLQIIMHLIRHLL